MINFLLTSFLCLIGAGGVIAVGIVLYFVNEIENYAFGTTGGGK